MNQNDPPTEHILACLSSSPSNAKIVRTAATMAKAFGGTFTALYVRTPDSDQMGKEDRRRLQQHIRMAEQAGADISTIYGDDIPQQIAEFARISGITKIVLGRSSVHRRHFWSGPSLTEKLTMTAPNLDIYIIPDASAETGYDSGRKLFTRPLLPSVRDLLITAGILSCITLIGFFFLQLDFARYNIIMLYMLGVLFTALCTSGYTCGVLGSIASVALYNFFLTEPRLTFHAYDPGYQVTFALMLTSAIITCTLTTRLKDHAKMSAQAAFRTKILFDTNQLLQRAKSEEEILSQTASQLMKLLNRSLIVYPEQNGDLGSEQFFGVDGETAQNIFSAPEERDAANWTFANKSVPVQARIATRTQRDFILHFGPEAACLEWLGSTCLKNRWMPLKTVCCSPFWAKVRWPSKTAETHWKKSRQPCRQKMKSCGQTCCARSPMTCAPR